MIRVVRTGTNFVILGGGNLKPENETTQVSQIALDEGGFSIRLNIAGHTVDCEQGVTRERVVESIQHMLRDAGEDDRVDEENIEHGLNFLSHIRRSYPALGAKG